MIDTALAVCVGRSDTGDRHVTIASDRHLACTRVECRVRIKRDVAGRGYHTCVARRADVTVRPALRPS